MTLRRPLDLLYGAAGWLAALFLIGTLAMVLLGIAGRLLHFHVPGTDAYAGYCMAATGFLALAHTLKRGEHIRVTLILDRLGGKARHRLELWALAVGVLLAGLFAFYSAKLAYQSWDFHDVSTASDATPLWLPQLTMALGTLVLFIALLDELVLEARGLRRPRSAAKPAFNE
jgi:TRAP-type C4-dicarboxylate transport system permease small subunit